MNAYGSTSARKIDRSSTLPIIVSFALLVVVAVILNLAGVSRGIVLLISVLLVDAFFFSHACLIIGRAAAIKMFLIGIIGAFLFEDLLGLRSGLYEFTDLMGPKLDYAPLSIGLAWMAVFYMGWFMANLVCDGTPSPRNNSIPRIIVKSLVAAFIVSATDLAADPVSVEEGLWVWYDGGPFFGVPYSNYIGWIVVGTVILSIIGIVNKSNCDASIDSAPSGARILSIVPLACFGLLGIAFIVQNYAGVMGIIELYAMGATFLIALVRWVDWLRREEKEPAEIASHTQGAA
ncbi:MAG: carotenoid biosynthesis protein [Eggerthellaceae bacterium]|nr:carotenoid biosynthesis protein [Eggerthellaceae bacterium]